MFTRGAGRCSHLTDGYASHGDFYLLTALSLLLLLLLTTLLSTPFSSITSGFKISLLLLCSPVVLLLTTTALVCPSSLLASNNTVSTMNSTSEQELWCNICGGPPTSSRLISHSTFSARADPIDEDREDVSDTEFETFLDNCNCGTQDPV